MSNEIVTCSNCGYETSDVDTATELCQTCKNAYDLGYQTHTEEGERMSKWIVVTEVESSVNPATFSYVNGTKLISSTEKEGEIVCGDHIRPVGECGCLL